MFFIKSIRAALAGSFLLLGSNFCCEGANAWPDRPVKFITLVGAGGGSDAVARTIADSLSREWGKPVVVENRPGADGIIAVDAFLGAHDGHTLLFASTGIVTANPLLHTKLSYDPARDLLPICFAVEDFIAIATSPKLPKTLPALVKFAQEHGNPLNYASVPGPPYLFASALQSSQHFRMELVPYRNPLAAIQDLVESRIDVALMPIASIASLAEAQRLSIVAVTSPKRAAIMPSVPTVEEEGLAGLAFTGGLGFFAPRDMPAELRSKISADVARILAKPEVRQKIEALGYVVRAEGPDAFRQVLRDQAAKWATLAQTYHLAPAD